jgi:hypothetical protein
VDRTLNGSRYTQTAPVAVVLLRPVETSTGRELRVAKSGQGGSEYTRAFVAPLHPTQTVDECYLDMAKMLCEPTPGGVASRDLVVSLYASKQTTPHGRSTDSPWRKDMVI